MARGISEGVGGATAVARREVAVMASGLLDRTWAIISDSTGNDPLDHFQQFIDDYLLPTAAPAYLGQFVTWDDTSHSYTATGANISATLNPTSGSVLLVDDFNRADGAVGTTSSGGQTWAANTLTITSNRAAIAAGGGALQTAGDYGSDNLIYEMDFEALASGNYRVEGLYNTSGDKGVFVQFNSSGMTLFLKVAAGTRSIKAGSFTLTTGVTYKIQLIVQGLWIGARIIGVDDASCGDYITSSEKSELGQKAYFAGPNGTGRIDNTRIMALANTRKLKVYNGSHPGATVDYHASRIASIVPEAPNLVWISLGHNNDGTDTAAQFLARMDAMIASIRALYPNVPVLVSSQNYRTDASASAAHERFAALRAAWASRGWGYEEVQLPDSQWTGLIAGDGIHPTYPAGQAHWATIDKAHFGV